MNPTVSKYVKAVGIWFLIIPLAILNGALRERDLCPHLADAALLISALLLSAALLLVPRIKGAMTRDLVGLGVLWCFLAILSDLGGLPLRGRGLAEFVAMVNPVGGHLWFLVVFTVLLAPFAVGTLADRRWRFQPPLVSIVQDAGGGSNASHH